MRPKRCGIITLLVVILGMAIGLTTSSAAQTSMIEAREVHRLWAKGHGITIIDIRPRRDFTQGHIPGAMNVPKMVVKEKRLPPLGRVVVVGDGIDEAATLEAAEILGSKPGIEVEVMRGGYPAWQAMAYPTTEAFGTRQETHKYITYDELAKIAQEGQQDVVILDVRAPASSKGSSSNGGRGTLSAPVDLSTVFPGVPIKVMGKGRHSASASGARTTMSTTSLGLKRDASTLYVLIDSADGTAAATARRLKAMGITRYVILAGGEIAVERRGKTGRMRVRN